MGARSVPLFAGIRPYERSWLSRDVIAGITLAALAIPEVMGYTKISGTPVITGLYTMLLPSVAFAIFASSRHLVVGGDSATAAIMYAGIAALGISGLHPYSSQWLALASLSALLVAAFLLLARLARLGFLADFISRTVLVGFLTGVGIQVAGRQLPDMLGVTVTAESFPTRLWDIARALPQAHPADLAVSAGVIAVVLVTRAVNRKIPGLLIAVI